MLRKNNGTDKMGICAYCINISGGQCVGMRHYCVHMYEMRLHPLAMFFYSLRISTLGRALAVRRHLIDTIYHRDLFLATHKPKSTHTSIIQTHSYFGATQNVVIRNIYKWPHSELSCRELKLRRSAVKWPAISPSPETHPNTHTHTFGIGEIG